MLIVGMTINQASIAEQKRTGTGGKFGAKSSTAPTTTLERAPRRRVTQDGGFWESTAIRYNLDEDERDMLDAHLEDGTVEAEMTVDTLTWHVLADAVQPRLVESIEKQEKIDETISARIGAKIGHGRLINGDDAITLFESSSSGGPRGKGYGIALVHASEGRQQYRIDNQMYTSPDDIPSKLRKGRELATAFAAQRDALDESLEATDERDYAYERWNQFNADRR